MKSPRRGFKAVCDPGTHGDVDWPAMGGWLPSAARERCQGVGPRTLSGDSRFIQTPSNVISSSADSSCRPLIVLGTVPAVVGALAWLPVAVQPRTTLDCNCSRSLSSTLPAGVRIDKSVASLPWPCRRFFPRNCAGNDGPRPYLASLHPSSETTGEAHAIADSSPPLSPTASTSPYVHHPFSRPT